MKNKNENDEASLGGLSGEVGIKRIILMDGSIRCRVSDASTWYDMLLHSTNTALHFPVLQDTKNCLETLTFL